MIHPPESTNLFEQDNTMKHLVTIPNYDLSYRKLIQYDYLGREFYYTMFYEEHCEENKQEQNKQEFKNVVSTL